MLFLFSANKRRAQSQLTKGYKNSSVCVVQWQWLPCHDIILFNSPTSWHHLTVNLLACIIPKAVWHHLVSGTVVLPGLFKHSGVICCQVMWHLVSSTVVSPVVMWHLISSTVLLPVVKQCDIIWCQAVWHHLVSSIVVSPSVKQCDIDIDSGVTCRRAVWYHLVSITVTSSDVRTYLWVCMAHDQLT